MIQITIVILIIIIIGVIYHITRKRAHNSSEEGKVIVSDSFLPSMSSDAVVTSDNHVTSHLYYFKADGTIWICPTCECENSTNEEYCTVCFGARKE